MAITEDIKPKSEAPPPMADEADPPAPEVSAIEGAPSEVMEGASQMGARRFVYAAYFGGGVAIAFLTAKLVSVLWTKLQNYKPAIGEPRDEFIYAIAVAAGALGVTYYWRRTRARRLAEEVVGELSKVTWPSRKEVSNSTTVVIVATLVSTVFFALMDQFWRFLTDKVYGM